MRDKSDPVSIALNTVAALFERQHALETSLNQKQNAPQKAIPP